MTNIQLYFAIGVPTFTILASLLIGIFQLNHAVNQINLRFSTIDNRMNSLEGRLSSIESRLDARMAVIEGDIKTLVRLFGDFFVRLARLEERTAR